MVHIYYHIYAIDGVEAIIDEQLNLIKNHFNFPYILNIGISLANDKISIYDLLKKYNNIRDVRANGNEWITLDLIRKDVEKFGDSDYILYLHTKGASKQQDGKYENIITWRHLMNYFNIEKVKNVFKIFDKTEYNTYGVLYGEIYDSLLRSDWKLYSGNFWWAKASYLKTINLDGIKLNRAAAETKYIQSGENWKPYSAYDVDVMNHYNINFKREEYAK
jgi:hypothetical protein